VIRLPPLNAIPSRKPTVAIEMIPGMMISSDSRKK
jgi:hypothetical protein